jgi:phage terminase large subunit-like protein
MHRTRSAENLRTALRGFGRSSTSTTTDVDATLADLAPEQIAKLLNDWDIWARDDQLPPRASSDTPWRTWLFLGGRGAGKTRAGAEWVRRELTRRQRTGGKPIRIALIGETIGDVHRLMVEGDSGLLAVCAHDRPPEYLRSKNRLLWPCGSVAEFFSAERPEGLRGPQFHVAWCDELVKWRHADETWDMLQFGLRLGIAPQAVVTTTPKPLPLLKALLADPATVVTRAATRANRAYLASGFMDEIERRYAGTVLGRQELEGELLTEYEGALWRADWIESQRTNAPAELGRCVVAVDPPVTAHAKSDACGIVVAGRGLSDNRGYVLADRTVQGRSPDAWAREVAAAFTEFEADSVVVEVNQGGDLVEQVLRQSAAGLPIKKVRATRGKWLRAEPVAALYAEGRISHVGVFEALEQQMLTFGTRGLRGGVSPDRLDALVWAMTDLMLEPQPRPSIKRI